MTETQTEKLIVFTEDDGTRCVGFEAGVMLPFDRVVVARINATPVDDERAAAMANLIAASANMVVSLSDRLNVSPVQLAERDVLGLLWDAVEEMHRTMTCPSRELLDSTRRELKPWIPMLRTALAACRKEGT